MIRIDLSRTEPRPDGLCFDPVSGVLLARHDRIRHNPDNPRQSFPEDEQAALRADIDDWRQRGRGLTRSGLMEPLKCKWAGGAVDADGNVKASAKLFLVDGERRHRVTTDYDWVPITLDDMSDEEATDVAVRTSIHKKLLSPIEEAHRYRRKMEANGWGYGKCAKFYHVHESVIRNRVYLLDLPPDCQRLADELPGTITHALAIGDKAAGLNQDERGDLIELVRDGLGVVPLKGEIARIQERKQLLAESQRAPDQQTQQRSRLHAQGAGGGVSRGRIMTGTPQSEAKEEVERALKSMEAALMHLGVWLPKCSSKYRAQVALPHLQRIGERASATSQGEG